jgi:hypothetical protein
LLTTPGALRLLRAYAKLEDGVMRRSIVVVVENVAEGRGKAQAADKKLAGAAMTSFMKKWESDAKKSCEADSKAKKLSGAAKNSHTKKYVEDAVGT